MKKGHILIFALAIVTLTPAIISFIPNQSTLEANPYMSILCNNIGPIAHFIFPTIISLLGLILIIASPIDTGYFMGEKDFKNKLISISVLLSLFLTTLNALNDILVGLGISDFIARKLINFSIGGFTGSIVLLTVPINLLVVYLVMNKNVYFKF